MPVVFSYVSEFFTEKQTGPIVVITAACWQPGIAFTGKDIRSYKLLFFQFVSSCGMFL